jgi:putative colanic acid biosynthesis UDP-glucose lipid carrier transferase
MAVKDNTSAVSGLSMLASQAERIDSTTPRKALEEHFLILQENKADYPLDMDDNKMLKRSFDILFSSLIILGFLSWILPILAICIKLSSKGPVFFKQKRTGINNHPFTCWKLRTMYLNEDAHTRQASFNDPRITWIGSFLRKFSLDEIPQFFNVFIGNMSLVGPRPHMIRHTEQYSRVIDKYMLRHFVKPGITGLSQVQGYRGEIRDEHALRNRVRLDVLYLERWHFMLDMRIILKTIKLMLFGDRNAY